MGRFTIRGSAPPTFACDGTAQPFSVQVTPENGKFAGGKAASVTFAPACGSFECGFDYEERIVQLRGKRA